MMEAKRMTLREIDAAVAERVMGWPIFDGPAHIQGDRPYPHAWRRRRDLWDGDVFDGTDNFRFQPTADIADAWQAADHLRGQAGGMTLTAHDSGCRVAFVLPGDWIEGSTSASAATAPLAICLAALRAHGLAVAVAE